MKDSNSYTLPEGKRRVLYILTPSLFLILCFGFVNLVPLWINEELQVFKPVSTITNSRILESAVDITPTLPIMTPTPQINTILPTATPALPPNAAIKLLGPPPDSSFQLGDTIMFFGQWPLPLAEGQSLGAYMRLNGKETLLSRLDEPNMGQVYRWQVEIEMITDTAVSVDWLIRLESESSSLPLVESESRTLALRP